MLDQFDQPSQPGVSDDQPAAPASGDGAAVAPEAGAPEPAPAPEWTPDQVREWRQAYDNQHAWAKENTQRAQYLAEQQRALETQQRQFFSDPINRQIYELRQQLYNPDGSINEQRMAQLERLSAGISQGGQDPLVTGLAGKVRQLEGTVQQMTFAEQQRMQQAIMQEGVREAEEFRAGLGADEFPNTPDGDRAFVKFMREEYPLMGTDRIEHAYRIARWDQLTARERERARTEMAATDAQAREAGTGIQPGAHEPPPPAEGNPNDWGFEGARERCMQLYGDVNYEPGE